MEKVTTTTTKTRTSDHSRRRRRTNYNNNKSNHLHDQNIQGEENDRPMDRKIESTTGTCCMTQNGIRNDTYTDNRNAATATATATSTSTTVDGGGVDVDVRHQEQHSGVATPVQQQQQHSGDRSRNDRRRPNQRNQNLKSPKQVSQLNEQQQRQQQLTQSQPTKVQQVDQQQRSSQRRPKQQQQQQPPSRRRQGRGSRVVERRSDGPRKEEQGQTQEQARHQLSQVDDDTTTITPATNGTTTNTDPTSMTQKLHLSSDSVSTETNIASVSVENVSEDSNVLLVADVQDGMVDMVMNMSDTASISTTVPVIDGDICVVPSVVSKVNNNNIKNYHNNNRTRINRNLHKRKRKPTNVFVIDGEEEEDDDDEFNNDTNTSLNESSIQFGHTLSSTAVTTNTVNIAVDSNDISNCDDINQEHKYSDDMNSSATADSILGTATTATVPVDDTKFTIPMTTKMASTTTGLYPVQVLLSSPTSVLLTSTDTNTITTTTSKTTSLGLKSSIINDINMDAYTDKTISCAVPPPLDVIGIGKYLHDTNTKKDNEPTMKSFDLLDSTSDSGTTPATDDAAAAILVAVSQLKEMLSKNVSKTSIDCEQKQPPVLQDFVSLDVVNDEAISNRNELSFVDTTQDEKPIALDLHCEEPAIFSSQQCQVLAVNSTTGADNLSTTVSVPTTTSTNHTTTCVGNDVTTPDSTATVNRDETTRTTSTRTRRTKTIVDANMKRCLDLVECQQTINDAKQKLLKLRQEHSKIQLMASLACPTRSATVWNSLPKRDKWKKEYVLAVLLNVATNNDCSGFEYSIFRPYTYLPSSLRESNWEKYVPVKLRIDKEIFLARITTQHFRNHYSYCCSHTLSMLHSLASTTMTTSTIPVANVGTKPLSVTSSNTSQLRKNRGSNVKNQPHSGSKTDQETNDQQQTYLPSTFVIPKQFWNDRDMMRSITYNFPELLMYMSSHHPRTLSLTVTSATKVDDKRYCLWDDPKLFLQWIRSPYLRESKALRQLAPFVIEKFNPRTIRNSKDLMLLAIRTLSWTCFDKVHPSLFNNVVFVTQVFNRSKLTFSNQTFAELLGSDITALNEQLPDKLMPAGLLELCSLEVRDNKSVVLSAVRQNGLTLQFASDRLRKDKAVILEACNNNPIAFAYARNSNGCRDLKNSPSFWLDIIFKKLELECQVLNSIETIAEEGGVDDGKIMTQSSIGTKDMFCLQQLWTLVPSSLQRNRNLVVAAVKAGCLGTDDVPAHLQNDESFWIEMLHFDSSYWYKMPPSFRDNASIVQRGILKFGSEDLIAAVFLQFSCLRSDRSIWEAVIKSIEPKSPKDIPRLTDSSPNQDELDTLMLVERLFTDPFSSLIEDGMLFDYDEKKSFSLLDSLRTAPLFILEDVELMIEACRRESSVYSILRPPLSEHRDVVQAALQCTPEAIQYISSYIQRIYPDLVADAIKALPQTCLSDYFDCIDDSLWYDNRQVAIAWVSNRGNYLHEEFPISYENDEEIFLSIAKYHPHDFWCASETLCGNKEFMKKVLMINGDLLSEACSTLSKDFDLATIAFATTSDLASRYDINDLDDFTFITSLALHIRQQLREVSNFQNLFLCSVSFDKVDGSNNDSCKLPLLDQGNETSTAYKKLIFDYIGLPTGQELQRLRQASANLATWGY